MSPKHDVYGGWFAFSCMMWDDLQMSERSAGGGGAMNYLCLVRLLWRLAGSWQLTMSSVALSMTA